MANQHTRSSISFGPLHTLEYIMHRRFKLLNLQSNSGSSLRSTLVATKTPMLGIDYSSIIPCYLICVLHINSWVSRNVMYNTLVQYTTTGQNAMTALTLVSLSPSKYNSWLAPGFLVWHLRCLDIKLVTMRSYSLSESSARFNGFVSGTTVLNNH